MQPSTQIKSFFLQGPSGRLEALLNAGRNGASHAAMVCHPHPLYGGTMHNKVVYHAAKALNGLGFPVLRFNFRGTGRSEGQHDGGHGERDDVRCALDWLQREFGLPVVFAGFSFGAAVGLHVCCPDLRAVALISLGTPVSAEGRNYRYAFLEACAKPKLFVSGGADPYGPRDVLQEIVARAQSPKELVLIEGTGHFFEGKLEDMRRVLEGWLKQILGPKS